MTMRKRISCLLLALVMVALVVPTGIIMAGATGTGEVTRAQWVQALVQTFSMTVEEDNYPDNYFTDITAEDACYRDILVAVEFGVIDQEAGTAFNPDAPATREFAAHTLNYCLGYQLDTDASYTFSESQAVTYPDDIQVALNRGWFTLTDGAFLPETAITEGEKTAMLADAAAVLAEDEAVSEENTYEFAEGVTQIPESAAELKDDGTVEIVAPEKAIAQGDLFAVCWGGMPVVYRADAVAVSGNVYTVTVTPQELTNYLVSINAGGEMDSNLADFQVAEGLEAVYVLEDGTRIDDPSKVGGTEKIKSILFHKQYGDLSLTIDLYDMKMKWHANGNIFDRKSIDVSAVVSGKISCSASVAFGASASDFDRELVLGTVPIGGIGSITVSADVSIDGSVTLYYGANFKAGVAYSYYEGFRVPHSFKKTKFSVTVEATLDIGVTASASVGIPFLSASCSATIGSKTNCVARYRGSDADPSLCIHTDSWLYAQAGVYASAGIDAPEWLGGDTFKKSWSNELIIWDRDTSPVRSITHFEDGEHVDSCSYGETNFFGYNSYYYSGRGSRYANGGVGAVANVPTYTYTVNEEGDAIITGYSGGCSALSIPATIDGYKVVGIGQSAFDRTGLYAVTIPAGVVDIADRAFEYNENLQTINLPNTLTSIGYEAFRGCTALAIVKIPDSVTQIEGGAFAGCTNLRSVKLSNGLLQLGGAAFYTCTNLTEIVIPKSLETAYTTWYATAHRGPFDNSGLRKATFEAGTTLVANNLFNGARNLTDVTLLDTMTTIGDDSFRDCISLTDIAIPASVTSIGDEAFYGCTGFVSFTMPDSVTEIKTGAFSDCTNLKTINLSKNLVTLGGAVFYKCDALTEIVIPKSLETANTAWYATEHRGPFDNSALETVTFEEGTTGVVHNLFSGARKLKNVTLLDSMTYLGDSSFKNCKLLAALTVPNTITSIGDQTFYGCTDFETFTMPDSVTEIKTGAFSDCTNLKTINLSKNLVTLGGAVFYKCDALTEIVIPKALETANTAWYATDHRGPFDNSGLQKATFEEGTTGVVNNLFSGARQLSDVTLLNSMTYLGDSSFKNCKQLVSLTVPDTITSIGEQAFYACTGIETFTMPDSVEEIKTAAFSDCTNLKTINLSKKLTTLGGAVFYKCEALTEVVIPKSLANTNTAWYVTDHRGPFDSCGLQKVTFEEGTTAVLNNCFKGAAMLSDVTLLEGMTYIGEKAFYKCASLQSIAIPASVTKLNAEAFRHSGLTTVEVPDTVLEMGNYVFADCASLTKANLPAGHEVLKEGTFLNNTSLTDISLPVSLQTIGKYAFKNCDALVTVTLPENLVKVENQAFYDCDALTQITFPGKVTTIDSEVCYDCDALTTVTMGNYVTSLGASAFRHCDLLKDVTLSLYLTQIPAHAFRECAELEQIVVPYFTTSIASGAFNASPKLAKVVVSKNVTSIQNDAFSYPNITVFYGTAGSSAETWATQNGYQFKTNDVKATALTVSETNMTMTKGSTGKLMLNVAPVDFGDTIVFKSNKTDVVTVTETGELKAVGVGTATIKITAGGVSATCRITVTQAVTRITLDKSRLSLDVPNTYQLTATVKPDDASNKAVTWTSSNEAAATVDENGLVTAVGNGTAVITATAQDGSGISASCTVTVTDPNNIPVTRIQLNTTSKEMGALDTYQLTATVSPNNAANKTVLWSSSDETVATVDENGLVTALTKGSATITATAADGYGATATCSITVTNTAYVVTDVAALESPHNYPDNCTDAWFYTVEGASSLEVTFDERTNMEDSFDYLHIYDGQGNLVGTYTGTELAGQTVSVPGDTVKIQLQSDDSGTEWGFKVTNVTTGHVHAFGQWTQTQAPTCTEEGVETSVCECGESQTRPVAALGHNHQSVTTEPGCETQGYTTHTCQSCGDNYADSYVDALGHDWDEGVVTVEPTEETEGQRKYTCQRCGQTKTEAIPTLEHTHNYQPTVTPPTCTEGGYTLYTCSCGDTYTEDYTDATGHDYQSVVTPPTTESQGYTTHTCQNCGDSYTDSYVDALTASVIIGDQTYGSITEALAAAESGDTVQLMTDVDATGETLIVRPGVTLNLGTHDLIADGFIGFNGSYLNATRYSATGDYGKLIVPKENLVLTGGVAVENGEYDVIPVWNGEDAYVLANAMINDTDAGYGLTIDEENKTISFSFAHKAGGSANKAFFLDGTGDNAMKIIIRLEWASGNGVAYQDFVYNDDFVGKVSQGGYNYSFVLNNYDILNIDISNLKVTAMIITDSGTITAGQTWTQQNAN